MRRRPLRLTLGDLPFDVLPDGSVRVALSAWPRATGKAQQKTLAYGSLREFLNAMLGPLA